MNHGLAYFFSDGDEDTEENFLVLTETQIEILEGAYENDETVGPIDIEHVRQLIDLMVMKKGEASEIAVENWWTSKYLLEKIRNTERQPFTNLVAVSF